MNKTVITSAMILSLAAGGVGMAATHTPKPAAPPPATASKSADCAKQWKAEKKHSQTRKAFMAACTRA